MKKKTPKGNELIQMLKYKFHMRGFHAWRNGALRRMGGGRKPSVKSKRYRIPNIHVDTSLKLESRFSGTNLNSQFY